MSRKKHHKSNQNYNNPRMLENSQGTSFVIEPEIKQSIIGVLLLTLAIIFLLSCFGLAGSVGQFIFNVFNYLFGWGSFLFPCLLMILAYYYFRAGAGSWRVDWLYYLGAFLILFASLSVVEIFKDNSGGIFGKMGVWFAKYLDNYALIVIYLALFAIGWVLILRKPIRIFSKKKELPISKVPPVVTPTVNEMIASAGMESSTTENQLIAGEEKSAPEVKKNNFFTNLVSKNRETREKEKKEIPIKIKTNYVLPPIDLLDTDSSRPSSGDIRANANIIKRTLESFGIEVEMGEVNVGPTVTQYTLKPAEGVKLSSITALQNDLALALAAHPLRIEAPIPGKSMVGIEVPNKSIALVRLGNLLKELDLSRLPSLAFPLGRDVKGEIALADLAEMPHLLVAGATGSGKSVCLHSILCSFLMKNSPESLRLILIDPKRVELTRYNGVPHLLSPVITDHKKVIPAMKWAIKEMERRYDLLSAYGARDITSFNKKMIENKESTLPYIVIMVDELADLMMFYGRDLEGFIVRIAQMARAIGIHLVVSTQRPSVEVVTGLIKANITSRIAFQVASQVDSRTVLDMAGAEKLLGHGDMLYLSPQSSKPRRIQGAYVSEREIDRLVKFIVKQKEDLTENGSQVDKTSELEDELQAHDYNGGHNNMGLASNEVIDLDELVDEDVDDELYPEAYETVVQFRKASASLLQRKLKIGYARAARLLDLLESRGVIGPGDGAKPREVFVNEDANQENKSTIFKD
ncbi:MAG: DNA translocase SpoIIIE [Parcubacteria group bacterium ADurb.Bin305]|nr:MAG: DNA translocase SpoIIIE [Parcubacteria group bacterium ADurb.Bin305]